MYHISWSRDSSQGGNCNNDTVASGNLIGSGTLACHYGCSGTITQMSYICTDFSIDDNWSFGEHRLTYNITEPIEDTITISFTNFIGTRFRVACWIYPLGCNWNISTTFSLNIRNDTSQINSPPRAIMPPVLRLQTGCRRAIPLAVSDPDGDIIRCRWAVGRECGGVCNSFVRRPQLDRDSCTVHYEVNRGTGTHAVAIMIEDFIPGSLQPLSSVALQFIVLVFESTDLCSEHLEFIDPTPRHGSCVAVPPGTTFTAQLTATSGSLNASINEIQTVSPNGSRSGQVNHIIGTNIYYVNLTWNPTASQRNETYSFCYTAVNSENLTSGRTCINLLVGYYPPSPLPNTATTNQLNYRYNTEWYMEFDKDVQRAVISSYIIFYEFATEEEVYRINASFSSDIHFGQSRGIRIRPTYFFKEKSKYYINFERGAVRGTVGCGAGIEPITNKTFWTFETLDITPPDITFLNPTSLSNGNISLLWESNENVTWECSLVVNSTTSSVNCSGANWRGYNLNEGRYELIITATDDAGNVATLARAIEVDLTPPTVTRVYRHPSFFNRSISFFEFTCDAFCTAECWLSSNASGSMPVVCGPIRTFIVTLQHSDNYTLSIIAMDSIGNRAEPVFYKFEIDLVSPVIFGILNISVPCGSNTSPNFTGEAQVIDDRTINPELIHYDFITPCYLRRAWGAIDEAHNRAYLVQYINFVYNSTLSYLPQLSFLCDSALNVTHVPSNTATAPNPCGLPLQISYTDSISEYTCPGQFVRNWTVSACGTASSYVQEIVLCDVCQTYERNDSAPIRSCLLGEYQCNQPSFCVDCGTVIIVKQVNDSVLQETEQYTVMLAISQGTPPLNWSLVTGPPRLRLDQFTGQVSWDRAEAGNYTITVQVENQFGQSEITWNVHVIPGYTAVLTPVTPDIYPSAQHILLSGTVEYGVNNLVQDFHQGLVPVAIDIFSSGYTRTIYTRTTTNGNFAVSFYRTEYGYYQAGARHPSQLVANHQIQWGIQGMKATPNAILLSGEAISTFEGTFHNATIICNDGPGILSGLTVASSSSSVTRVQLTLSSNVALQTGDKVFLDIRLLTFRSAPVTGSLTITVQSREGTSLQIRTSFRITRSHPNFVIEPPSIDTTVIRGSSQLLQFNVTNTGIVSANAVRALLSNNESISIVNFGIESQTVDSFDLNSGETAILSLLIQIPPNHQFAAIYAPVTIFSTQRSQQIPIRLIVISNVLMNLTVIVEDECTHIASGEPLVNYAAIRLIGGIHDTHIILTTYNGTVTFINIYEDYYHMYVYSLRHRFSYQGIITSVDNPVITVFLYILEPCLVFVDPTLPQGSCVAISQEGTFTTQLTATSGSINLSIAEIQTFSPNGTITGELQHITNTSTYFVNVTWTPIAIQQNDTHSFCYTAVNSEGLASEQTCIQLLAGYYPPTPIPYTATPNHQLIDPSNTTWYIEFDRDIQRPVIPSYIIFYEFTSELEVYRIDASSPEVNFDQSNSVVFSPMYNFTEKSEFYINFQRGVVKGTVECGPENEPVTNKTFWTFEVLDITPPDITFIQNPSLSNSNISVSWESNENVTWECSLVVNSTVNCSGANWRGYNLSEGRYELMITATDDAGNVATLVHTFEVDLTPPTVTITDGPEQLSNQLTSTIRFTCDESCNVLCQLSSDGSQENPISCNNKNFSIPTLQHNISYTLSIVATDPAGNTAEPVTYTWSTDFAIPSLFGVTNTSAPCGNTSPSYVGHAQVTDDIGISSSPTYVDTQLGCSLRRTWSAADNAGNEAELVQYINIIYNSTLSYLPQLSFPCESASNLIQVPSNTATAPNPCRISLQLSYTDSVSEYTCPGEFVRNWTIRVCSMATSFVQDVVLYDVCPPYACGRNETTPRGICSRRRCYCNRPWYGDNCSVLIYEPIAEQVNDSVLQEAEQYSVMLTTLQGTAPLTWKFASSASRVPQLLVNSTSGLVSWSSAPAGNYTPVVQVVNQVGQAKVSWNLTVIPGYTTFLHPMPYQLFSRAQPVVLTGSVEYVENNLVRELYGGSVLVHVDIIRNGITITLENCTNENGNFTVTFYPYHSDYGYYQAGSRHPNQSVAVLQIEWDVQGLKATPSPIRIAGEAVSNFQGMFYNATILCNDGRGIISGLTATSTLTNSEQLSVQVLLNPNITLQTGDKVALDIYLLALPPVYSDMVVTVQSSEGVLLNVPVNIQILRSLPKFIILPSSINTRILRGDSENFKFNITNNGSITATAVQALLPNDNITSVISFGSETQNMTSFDLQVGQSAILYVSIQIPSNQQLGITYAQISINSTQISTPFSISITVISNVLMNLTINVEDDCTHVLPGEPLVSDVAITLYSHQRLTTLRAEAGSGTVIFFDIYEDRYYITVSAPNHRRVRQYIYPLLDDSVIAVFMMVYGSCPLPPEFIDPTPPQGSCVAVPPETTFTTQLTATSGSSSASITEIQTVSPNGTTRGELQHNTDRSIYFVNILWTPAANQQHEAHPFCYTAVNSEGLTSEQTCIQLLVGYSPPVPLPDTATPNHQLVDPSNTTWYIEFNRDIQHPVIPSYIIFYEFTSELEVYRIDASSSSEVHYDQLNKVGFSPIYNFTEREKFYINLQRGVVRSTEGCGAGNEPITNKTFWTFETLDVYRPNITFLQNSILSNGNITLSWESNENVTWECSLVVNSITSSVNCSGANWRGYNLSEGRYELMITATDDAGNVATLLHIFEVDLTPPTVTIMDAEQLSSVITRTVRFACNEVCTAECQLSNDTSQGNPTPCNNERYYTSTLHHNISYTLSIVATDQIGNTAEPVTYTWRADFVIPSLFGVTNTSAPCGNTSPNYVGHAQATDDIGISFSPTYVDARTGCTLRRTWRAEDNAGNRAELVQYINIIYTSTLSYLPQLSFLCESATNLIEVPSNTATAPNPCRLPLQLSYTDSVSEYTCPGEFARNWTISVCGMTTSFVQDIVLYDVCPPYACGRNESTPRGICSLGVCQCNRPWYGDDCSLLIYEPIAEQVNDSVLLEAEQYSVMLTVSQGTPPLTWSLLSGPRYLRVDLFSGLISWSRAQAGNHTVVVQVENEVGRTEITWVLQVIPGYTAILYPISPNLYPFSQPIVLTGTVEYASNSLVQDFLAGFVPVDIDIISNGFTRTVRTFANTDGEFAVTFYPAVLEYGYYQAGSKHPSQSVADSQSQWGVQGLKASLNTISLTGEAVSNFEGIFYNTTVICNDGPGILTSLTVASSLGNSELASVQFMLSSNVTLQPGDKVSLSIQLMTSRPVNGFFIITVRSSQGTSLQINTYFRIEPILPNFVIEPSSLNTRVVRGRSQVFMFNITNTGRITANAIQTLLPNSNIFSLISFGDRLQNEAGFDLEREQSAVLSISIQTPSSQQLGDISASIAIISQQLSASIPIRLTVSSNLLMNLTVIVEDEFTYFASGEPLVNYAAITLTNNQRGIRITLTTEAGNGTVTFINIHEDRYEMSLEAPDHLSLCQVIVTSVDDPVITVFMQRQTVIISWNSIPIPYEDNYEPVIEADFVTNVPIPVVTVDPAEIDLEQLELGFVSSFQLNITNHGLIRANDTRLELPKNHPFLQFTTPTTELGFIEPLSSVIVTINVSRKVISKRQSDSFICGTLWVAYGFNILYNYICDIVRNRMVPVVLKKQASTIASLPECDGGGGVGSISRRVSCIGCGSTGGSDFRFDGYVADTMINCQQCIQALVDLLGASYSRGLMVPQAALQAVSCARMLAGNYFNGNISFNSIIWDTLDFIQSTCGDEWTIRARSKATLSKCLTASNMVKRNAERSAIELVEAMYPILQSIELGIEVLGDDRWLTDVDDSHWLSHILQPTLGDSSEAGILISNMELSTILAAPPPNGTTTEMVQRLVERLNNTLHGWNSGQLEPVEGANMASFSRVQEVTESIITYSNIAIGKGFSSYIEAYNFARDDIIQMDQLEAEEGVCAVVRIRIDQELAVTRTAFLAKLEIENMDESPLERGALEILIIDSGTREVTTHLFAIGDGSLSGSLTDGDGAWTLPSETSGSIEWLIIPYSEAAPESDRSYDVGGTLRYSLGGENITVPLIPAVITVTPDPSLLVHYFWERFVVGDDPFTDEVEDSVPFTLGVAVKNAGHGVARSLQITSGQPEITENERGLLINFMIIGVMIGNGNVAPTLTVMFGDLPPETTKVARWQIISSLQGEFRGYSATFENINPLGDPNLSILDELEIHELIRNVRIYNSPEDDGVLDFLVNELDDLLAFPDALYSSKTLERYNVSVGTILSVRSITTTILEVRTFTNTTGWVYYRYEDTQGLLSNTAPAINATKQEGNGTIILPAENLWITRDRDANSDTDTLYLHMIDNATRVGEVMFNLNLCISDCIVVERSFARSVPSK